MAKNRRAPLAKKLGPDTRARRWAFTINNYTDVDREYCADIDVKFLCYSLEICPDTGTPHIQGYLECKSQARLGTLSRKLPRAHLEPAREDAYTNIVYCSPGDDPAPLFWKGENPLEPDADGNRRGQGARNDLAAVKRIIDSGGSMADVWDAGTSLQGLKYAEMGLKIRPALRRKRLPNITWLWGPTGTGKTHLAKQLARRATNTIGSDDGFWMTSRDLKWWGEYRGQEAIIIDDFRADFCKFHELLRILDVNDFNAEIKYGQQPLLAHSIFITCPYPPDQVYAVREDIGQLLRRIKVTEHLSEQFTPVTVDPELADDLAKRVADTKACIAAFRRGESHDSQVEGNSGAVSLGTPVFGARGPQLMPQAARAPMVHEGYPRGITPDNILTDDDVDSLIDEFIGMEGGSANAHCFDDAYIEESGDEDDDFDESYYHDRNVEIARQGEIARAQALLAAPSPAEMATVTRRRSSAKSPVAQIIADGGGAHLMVPTASQCIANFDAAQIIADDGADRLMAAAPPRRANSAASQIIVHGVPHVDPAADMLPAGEDPTPVLRVASRVEDASAIVIRRPSPGSRNVRKTLVTTRGRVS